MGYSVLLSHRPRGVVYLHSPPRTRWVRYCIKHIHCSLSRCLHQLQREGTRYEVLMRTVFKVSVRSFLLVDVR